MKATRRAMLTAPAMAAGLMLARRALAQNWPDRPIRMIVPAGPGGPNDVLARLVAQYLQPTLGSPVVVENRTGAGGLIGARYVAAAEPDGYTLLIGNTATLANIPAFAKNAGYDPVKSFAAVAKFTDSYQILVVRSDFPAKNLAELIAYAKTNPGKLNFGSAGAGNLTHLSAELLKLKAGIDIVHVPYKSTGESMTAVLGGQVHLIFGSISIVLPLLREGKLRALAVTGTQRAPELPDVPTMVEGGLPGYVVTSFFGVVAPAGTPAPIVGKLNATINDGLRSPQIRAGFNRLGAEPSISSPEEFQNFIADELAKWSEVARSVDIKID